MSGCSSAPAFEQNQSPDQGLLGTIAKSTDPPPQKQAVNEAIVRGRKGRNDRFRHQRHAAEIVNAGIKDWQRKERITHCRWTVCSKDHGVDVVTSTYADDRNRIYAHFDGLQTCGSVWMCPCCSARIADTRRNEMNQLLQWARANDYYIYMVTLTARHSRADHLKELLAKMKKAKGVFSQGKAYRNLKTSGELIGTVTATEVTYGDNGWHPHFHMIVVTKQATDLDAKLRGRWMHSLEKAGLDGNGAAFDVRSGQTAGQYVAKWGAAEELALAHQKSGRAGRTPAQLLAASSDEGDEEAKFRWVEYARAFKGRRQLVWSRGLKDLCGLDEISDEEAATDEMQDDQVEEDRATISYAVWKSGVASKTEDRRAELLDKAESEGPAAAVQKFAVEHSDEAAWIVDPAVRETKRNGLVQKLMCQIHPPQVAVDWQRLRAEQSDDPTGCWPSDGQSDPPDKDLVQGETPATSRGRSP